VESCEPGTIGLSFDAVPFDSDVCLFFFYGDRTLKFEATVNTLEVQLEEQCSDTDNAISQWARELQCTGGSKRRTGKASRDDS
jgi:hypothetical protein